MGGWLPASFNTEEASLKPPNEFARHNGTLLSDTQCWRSSHFSIQMWLQSLRIVTKGIVLLSVLGLCTSVLKHKMPNCALTKGCSMARFYTTVLIQMQLTMTRLGALAFFFIEISSRHVLHRDQLTHLSCRKTSQTCHGIVRG